MEATRCYTLFDFLTHTKGLGYIVAGMLSGRLHPVLAISYRA